MRLTRATFLQRTQRISHPTTTVRVFLIGFGYFTTGREASENFDTSRRFSA